MGGRVGAIVEQCWHRVPGGTATSTVASLAALAKRSDWEVIGVAAAHRSPANDLAIPAVEVCHMRLGRVALYEAWHRFRWPSIQGRTGPLDIVHATGGVIPPLGGASLVVTIHDLAFLHHPDFFHKRGVSFMKRAFALTKRHASMVLVPSMHTFDDCVGHGLTADRLCVVPWGVNAVVVNELERREVRVRYRLPEQFLLWVGTCEPRKNLKALVAAVARSETRLPLVLVGPSGWGVDPHELIAHELIAKAASPDGASANSSTSSTTDVRYLGPVPNVDLRVLYDLAEVFVYPSLFEGFGMPVLEAMAQGTPVVTSAGTATAEVADSAGVLVDPTSIDSIAAGIDSVVCDRTVRNRLALAAEKRASTMTWERTAREIAAVYDLVRQ